MAQELVLEPLPGGQTFEDLAVGTLGRGSIGVVQLARPQKGNACGEAIFERSFAAAVQALEEQDGVRVLVVCGQGRHFCTGIDVSYLQSNMAKLSDIQCPGRLREHFRRHIMALQGAFTVLEQCRWPVVAAVHGACIGGGVDLITACDIRVCSQDATFCVKEVDLAITADLGTLQRLPRIIGHGAAADLALTARTIGAEEAQRLGLVTQVAGPGREAVLAHALELAKGLAAKSPLALVGTKRVLLHTRDTPASVATGLEYVATHNSAMLLSEDLMQAVQRRKGAGPPQFSKL